MFKRISIIGLGYIGLPTAALFAAHGTKVIGVDIAPHVVQTINAGKTHIVEPGLAGLVHRSVSAGCLHATQSVEPAEAFLIAVPTPFKAGNQPDLRHIRAAAAMIAPVLKPGNLVILESTSPVGTTGQLADWLAAARPDLSFPQRNGDTADIQIAHCPERVLPGNALHELVQNDRIIGAMSTRAGLMAVALYKLVVRGHCLTTDARTAELCKLVENSARDVQIAFANELSVICDQLGVNVWDLIRLANRHPRINILQPGPGVGGHCIAVDPWFIVASAPQQAKLIRAARTVNDAKPGWVVQQAKAAILQALAANPSRSMSDIKVACLGLAFKPDIDDLRHSPALEITREIAALGAQVLAVEPHIQCLPAGLEGLPITLSPLARALKGADVICALVRHAEFLHLAQTRRGDARLVDVVGLFEATAPDHHVPDHLPQRDLTAIPALAARV